MEKCQASYTKITPLSGRLALICVVSTSLSGLAVVNSVYALCTCTHTLPPPPLPIQPTSSISGAQLWQLRISIWEGFGVAIWLEEQ